MKEKELVGLYISGHPLVKFSMELETLSNYHFDISLIESKLKYIKTGGMITDIRIRLDKKERKYAMLTLEGLAGSVGVMVFSSVYEQCKEFIEQDAVVFIEGKVDLKFGDGKILADKITPLEGAISRKTRKIHINIPTEKFEYIELDNIQQIFTTNTGDCEVLFHIFDKSSQKKTVRLKDLKIDPSIKFLNDLHKIIDKQYIRLE
jgi:DNA polymerase-3 subunit alpha